MLWVGRGTEGKRGWVGGTRTLVLHAPSPKRVEDEVGQDDAEERQEQGDEHAVPQILGLRELEGDELGHRDLFGELDGQVFGVGGQGWGGVGFEGGPELEDVPEERVGGRRHAAAGGLVVAASGKGWRGSLCWFGGLWWWLSVGGKEASEADLWMRLSTQGALGERQRERDRAKVFAHHQDQGTG